MFLCKFFCTWFCGIVFHFEFWVWFHACLQVGCILVSIYSIINMVFAIYDVCVNNDSWC